MKIKFTALSLTLLSSTAFSASFPHKTATYTTVTTAPMTNIESETYVTFPKDMMESVTAEWSTQKSPMGVKRTFNLTEKGVVFSLDLDTQHCTKTNIKPLTEGIKDPEQYGKAMRKQMGLQKSGSCEGAGLKGVEYSSPYGKFCFYKDVIMLWQESMGTITKITKIEFDNNLPKDKTRLPGGVKCVAGPDLSKGIGGMNPYGGTTPPGGDSMGNQAPPPQDMEEAMKLLNEMLKK